jgi:hypothetical protein
VNVAEKVRKVVLVLLGVAALALKHSLVEPSAGVIHCWGGNLAISFSCYFLAALSAAGLRHGQLVAAVGALLAVEAFEAADGFGVMSNVYDPIDFAANALGVGLGLAIDAAWTQLSMRR